MSNSFPKISLVLGGAASGKSAFAEKLTRAADRPRVYIATAQAYDAEMKTKISRHRMDRGAGWTTIEQPYDLVEALQSAPIDAVILIDCLTLWLSNHLLAKSPLDGMANDLLETIDEQPMPVICVSNEAGLGVVPDNKLARAFRQAQGELNQQIAAHADLVVSVTAGIPMVLKGQSPAGLA